MIATPTIKDRIVRIQILTKMRMHHRLKMFLERTQGIQIQIQDTHRIQIHHHHHRHLAVIIMVIHRIQRINNHRGTMDIHHIRQIIIECHIRDNRVIHLMVDSRIILNQINIHFIHRQAISNHRMVNVITIRITIHNRIREIIIPIIDRVPCHRSKHRQ